VRPHLRSCYKLLCFTCLSSSSLALSLCLLTSSLSPSTGLCCSPSCPSVPSFFPFSARYPTHRSICRPTSATFSPFSFLVFTHPCSFSSCCRRFPFFPAQRCVFCSRRCLSFVDFISFSQSFLKEARCSLIPRFVSPLPLSLSPSHPFSTSLLENPQPKKRATHGNYRVGAAV